MTALEFKEEEGFEELGNMLRVFMRVIELFEQGEVEITFGDIACDFWPTVRADLMGYKAFAGNLEAKKAMMWRLQVFAEDVRVHFT